MYSEPLGVYTFVFFYTLDLNNVWKLKSFFVKRNPAVRGPCWFDWGKTLKSPNISWYTENIQSYRIATQVFNPAIWDLLIAFLHRRITKVNAIWKLTSTKKVYISGEPNFHNEMNNLTTVV